MKRHLKILITGLAFAAFCLASSGCTLAGSTVSMRTGDAANGGDSELSTDSSRRRDVYSDAETDTAEPQQWSRLVKEGRQHLLLGRHAAAEHSLLAAFKLSNRYRSSDVRRRVSFKNLERLATSYRRDQNDAAATRVLQIITYATRDETEFSYPGLSDLALELGGLQLLAGATAEASVSFQRALDLRVQKSGANSSTLIEPYQRLSQAEISIEQFDLAVEHAEKSLTLSENLLGPKSAELVKARLFTATAYFAVRRYEDSEKLYLAALETLREINPVSVLETIVLNRVALVYLESNRLDEALTNVDLALKNLEEMKIGGINRVMILDTKAQILAADGETESASRLFAEVMAGLKAAKPTNQKVLFESFESFLRDQNRIDEAQEIRRQIDELGGLGPDHESATPDPTGESDIAEETSSPSGEAQSAPEPAEVSTSIWDLSSAP